MVITCPKCGAQIEMEPPPPPPHRKKEPKAPEAKPEKASEKPRPPAPGEPDKAGKKGRHAPPPPGGPAGQARKPKGAPTPPPPPEILIEQSDKFIADLDGMESSEESVSVKRMEILLKQFDKDSDGKLSAEERAAAKKEITKRKADFQRRENKFVKSMMTKFDKDDDGKLSEAEVREFVVYQRKASAEARSRGVPPHLGREPATRIPVEFFKSLGLDAKTMTFEQRHLVFGELKQIYAKGLKSHDANSDGKLDKKEVKALMETEAFKSEIEGLKAKLAKPKAGQ